MKSRKVRKAICIDPKPSEVQQQCITHIQNHITFNGSFHGIQAYAGTGKTTTLLNLLIQMNNNGTITSEEKVVIMMFNNSVKIEFEDKLKQAKLPTTTRFHVKTYMGYLMSKAALHSTYSHTKFDFDSKRKYNVQMKDLLYQGGLCKKLSTKLLKSVESTITNFCASTDDKLQVKHIDKGDIESIPEFSDENILNNAEHLWIKYLDPRSPFLLNMEKALKIMHLHSIKCPYKYILCDEAQDIVHQILKALV